MVLIIFVYYFIYEGRRGWFERGDKFNFNHLTIIIITNNFITISSTRFWYHQPIKNKWWIHLIPLIQIKMKKLRCEKEIEIENWKYNQEREMQKTLFSKDLCFCFLFCYFFNFWLISFSILAILKKLISFFHFFSF